MLFKELLNKYDDTAIIDKIVTLYPKEIECIGGYQSALLELRETDVVADDEGFSILVHEIIEGNRKGSMDVSGIQEGDDENWSFSLTEWGKWLGMPVVQESIDTYGELAVLAHCMWELCWHGYTNAEHTEIRDELDKRIEEIESGTAKLIPMEDVMAEARKMLAEKNCDCESPCPNCSCEDEEETNDEV